MSQTLSLRNALFVLFGLLTGLIARSWLQVIFVRHGMPPRIAADFSYLVVPPVVFLFMVAIRRQILPTLVSQFRFSRINRQLILISIATGILLRIAWWSQLVAGVSFGVYRSADPGAAQGPLFSFNCPAPFAFAIGIGVMVVLVPFVEEIVHRGLLLTALRRRGDVFAVILSALVFAVLHVTGTWLFAFFAGIVLGTQLLFSGSLWPPTITHGTINALVQLDWNCLRGQWNPSDTPVYSSGLTALLIFVLVVAGILKLIQATRRVAPLHHPRQ